MAELRLEIPGLTKNDVAEFEAAIPAGVDFEELPIGERQYGEPFTFVAVVALTTAAIGGLVAIFGKPKNRTLKKRQWSLRKPDGTKLTISFEDSEQRERPLDPEIIKAVTSAGINLEDFEKLLQG